MFHAILAALRPFQHRRIVKACPTTRAFPQGTTAADCGLAEHVLVRAVITDDPIAPERCHGIDVEGNAPPALRTSTRTSGGGIEGLPAVAGKVRFHPGMRILGADHVVGGELIVLVAAK